MNFKQHLSCSIILAASLQDLFPDIQLETFQATENCFFCDFSLPFPFNNETIPILEERMQNWIKKNIPFHSMEMNILNAFEMAHYEQYTLTHELKKLQKESSTEIFSLVRLGHFMGKSYGPTVSHTGEIISFKIFKAEAYGNQIRLIGAASESKKILKSQQDYYKNTKSHFLLAQELKFLSYSNQEWIWLEKGQKFRQIVLNQIFQIFFQAHLLITPAMTPQQLVQYHSLYIGEKNLETLEELKLPLVRQGLELFNAKTGTNLFFFKKENLLENLISCLQKIVKFLQIFSWDFIIKVGKSHHKVFHEALEHLGLKSSDIKADEEGIQFYLQDRLGRYWLGPQILYHEKEKLVQISIFQSLERFIALFLEKTQGNFPFFLQLNQICIFGKNKESIESIKKNLDSLGYRVKIDKRLNDSTRQLLHERAFFSIVVRNQDKKSELFDVYGFEPHNSVRMNLKTLMERLAQFEIK